jgi:hypothetical protein
VDARDKRRHDKWQAPGRGNQRALNRRCRIC